MKLRFFIITFIVLISLSCQTDIMSRSEERVPAGAAVRPAVPVITVQPKNAEYLVKVLTEPLSVTAIADDGGLLSYQWYKSTGSSFTDEELAVEFEKITSGNIKDIFYFSSVSGADESNYTPDAEYPGRFNYFCAVTNTQAGGRYASVAISNPAVVTVVEARTITFGLKSAPADLTVSLNGVIQRPISSAAEVRNYRINGAGTLSFSAETYRSIEYLCGELPVRNGLLEIKLENENGLYNLIGEYSTGTQPKSAYFSPDGVRLFVPLLDQHGVDVFRFDDETLVFEKRLTIPESSAKGFVEALTDERRRELWVSNMEESKVHIFDLDTLEYKMSLGTGGSYPKVITQNPGGSLTVVSNWVSQNISVFDSDSKELLRRIPTGGTPRGMAFSPDGRFLYTAIYDEPVIAVIDMTQNRVISRYRLYQGEGAMRHVIYRDGKLYASDMYRGTVNILNASTGALLVSRRIGPNINTIVISPDGSRIIASSRGRNNSVDYTRPGPDLGAVYILRAEDLSLEERIWGRNQPTGLAVSPNGRYLVFTDFLDANLELYEDISKR
jgi:DNA-binding beta-propeller fold protein YncE